MDPDSPAPPPPGVLAGRPHALPRRGADELRQFHEQCGAGLRGLPEGIDLQGYDRSVQVTAPPAAAKQATRPGCDDTGGHVPGAFDPAFRMGEQLCALWVVAHDIEFGHKQYGAVVPPSQLIQPPVAAEGVHRQPVASVRPSGPRQGSIEQEGSHPPNWWWRTCPNSRHETGLWRRRHGTAGRDRRRAPRSQATPTRARGGLRPPKCYRKVRSATSPHPKTRR